MGDLKIGTKSVFTQSGGAEPVLASTVTGGAGLSGMTSLGTVTTGTLASGVTGGSGLDALPNTSSISKWTISAHTSSGSVDPIVGWSGTTINLSLIHI